MSHSISGIRVPLLAITLLGPLLLIASRSLAEVQTYFSLLQWQQAAGQTTTIGFTGYPNGTIITTQFADEGITFTDGNDFIICCSPTGLPQDSAGLGGGFPEGPISVSFAAQVTAIAVHFPGALDIALFSQGQLMYASPPFGTGIDLFVGLISSVPFDAAILHDPTDNIVAIDNLYFSSIPSPASLSLLGASLMLQRRRSRC